MKMLILVWDHVTTTTVPKCFKKGGFSDESLDETFVHDDVTCDEILTFDDEVAVTQEILTDEMIVA